MYGCTSYPAAVVSYRNSTSNHNSPEYTNFPNQLYLIEILHQTTTRQHSWTWSRMLYLIEILHQTTTFRTATSIDNKLYLIEILHQTTTKRSKTFCRTRLYLIEILHQTTTCRCLRPTMPRLYLIEILHQTTTPSSVWQAIHRCILSKFYIKPQHQWICIGFIVVVSYRNSTSNHNSSNSCKWCSVVVSYRNSTSNHNLRGYQPVGK